MRRAILPALLLLVLAPAALAQPTPEGLWRTFDDHTGRERGAVRIEVQDGVLTGRIVATTDPADAARRCTRCTGARKDAPIIGLAIITNMHRDGDHWDGGQILDPENGDVYRCNLRLIDGGDRLVVRGFLGISLFGRSQTWVRDRPGA